MEHQNELASGSVSYIEVPDSNVASDIAALRLPLSAQPPMRVVNGGATTDSIPIPPMVQSLRVGRIIGMLVKFPFPGVLTRCWAPAWWVRMPVGRNGISCPGCSGKLRAQQDNLVRGLNKFASASMS